LDMRKKLPDHLHGQPRELRLSTRGFCRTSSPQSISFEVGITVRG
jgi:hypothetical protein